MTNSTFTCEQFAGALADYLERDTDERTRAAIDAHAASCDACGSLLADLRAIRIEAARLPELAPSRDLWANIAARIETPVVALHSKNDIAVAAKRRVPTVAWLGVAAAALIAVTATVTHEITRRSIVTSPTTPIVASRPDSPVSSTPRMASMPADSSGGKTDSTAAARKPAVPGSSAAMRLASNKPSMEETYRTEIGRLLVVYNAKQTELDSSTVAVVQKNLKIIDDAIAQCRVALRGDPASRFLLESLNQALDTKVQLLRTAVKLPSSM